MAGETLSSYGLCQPKISWVRVAITAYGVLLSLPVVAQPSLPAVDDIPEEILRTEIILEGRSPLDGEALTATEYTELMEALAESPNPPQLNPKLRNLVFLLQIRRFLRTFVPFL